MCVCVYSERKGEAERRLDWKNGRRESEERESEERGATEELKGVQLWKSGEQSGGVGKSCELGGGYDICI